MNFWAEHVAHMLWQTSLTALVVLALVRMMPHRSPQFRYAILTVAVLKFLIPPMLPLPTGLFSSAPPVPSIAIVRTIIVSARTGVWRELASALMLIHIAGIVVCVVRLAIRQRSLMRMRDRGRRLPSAAAGTQIAVLTSDEVAAPMSFGLFRPVIIIPLRLVASLTRPELDAVLDHEVLHIRRRDVFAIWLESIVSAIWWFDPFCHLILRERARLREECCDDALLASGSVDAATYARALYVAAASLAGKTPALAAGIMRDRSTLLSRMKRIAATNIARQERLRPWQMTAAAAIALLLLPGLRVSHDNHVAFDHATLTSLGIHR